LIPFPYQENLLSTKTSKRFVYSLVYTENTHCHMVYILIHDQCMCWMYTACDWVGCSLKLSWFKTSYVFNTLQCFIVSVQKN
jgi:hypothetical protein